jgi:hypothetical protein
VNTITPFPFKSWPAIEALCKIAIAWKVRVSDPRLQANVKTLVFGLCDGGGSAIAGTLARSITATIVEKSPVRTNLISPPMQFMGWARSARCTAAPSPTDAVEALIDDA